MLVLSDQDVPDCPILRVWTEGRDVNGGPQAAGGPMARVSFFPHVCTDIF